MSIGNLFQQLPEDLSNEVFTDILNKPSFRIERIVSLGHTSTDWYNQSQAEWVIVLQGAAAIAYDTGETFDLKPGSHLNIPRHQRHKVTYTDPLRETIWLAIHYDD